MKVVITGATGFVGSNLIPYLAERKINVQPVNRVELNSTVKLDDVDCIVHLAGKAHDLKNVANPEEYYQVNFALTKKLFDAFLQSGASKFIFLSSVKAVADSVSGVLTEDVEPNPKTDYGKSKLMAEQYIQQQPLPEGKSYYILRPCMIHGPGNKGNLNLLYKFVSKGIPYPLAAFKNRRSFLSIGNLCMIIQELLNQDLKSGVYNVSDDEPLTVNQVITVLAAAQGKKCRLWKINPGLVRLTAKIGDHFKLPLNSERLNKLTENYVVENAKIKQAIHKKLPLSSMEGLMLTAKSFMLPDP